MNIMLLCSTVLHQVWLDWFILALGLHCDVDRMFCERQFMFFPPTAWGFIFPLQDSSRAITSAHCILQRCGTFPRKVSKITYFWSKTTPYRQNKLVSSKYLEPDFWNDVGQPFVDTGLYFHSQWVQYRRYIMCWKSVCCKIELEPVKCAW